MLSKNWLLSCFLYHGMTFVSGHFKRLELPTIYKKNGCLCFMQCGIHFRVTRIIHVCEMLSIYDTSSAMVTSLSFQPFFKLGFADDRCSQLPGFFVFAPRFGSDDDEGRFLGD